jgi:hypothetical protein
VDFRLELEELEELGRREVDFPLGDALDVRTSEPLRRVRPLDESDSGLGELSLLNFFDLDFSLSLSEPLGFSLGFSLGLVLEPDVDSSFPFEFSVSLAPTAGIDRVVDVGKGVRVDALGVEPPRGAGVFLTITCDCCAGVVCFTSVNGGVGVAAMIFRFQRVSDYRSGTGSFMYSFFPTTSHI